MKEKKTHEENNHSIDGSRKHTKERPTVNLEESMNSNASGLSKRESPKKKKKDEAKHEVDLMRVKIEPVANASSEIAARNGEESSHSPRKRKAEMNKNEQSQEDLVLTTSKKKKLKSVNMATIVKQEPAMLGENSPRHSRKRQKDGADLGESSSLKQKKIISEKEFDLARVKTEPKESHKKKKHSKTKTY